MRVLVACEFSGVVREAFRKRGHDAWSCDILPAEDQSPYHLYCTVKNVATRFWDWDLMIAHPPCTYLCGAGAKHWHKRQQEQKDALNFVRFLLDAPIPKIALENPYGRISTAIRKPDQIVQPYWFGDPFQKTTHLWLKNLPKLAKTKVVDRGAIYTPPDGKQLGAKWLLEMGPSPDRWKRRSRTFQGIAEAMADQWGSL